MIPDSIFSSKFDRETTRVTSSIGRSTFSSDGRETSGSLDFGTDFLEELSASEVGNIVSNFKSTVSSSSLCVNYTFRNTLSVEVGETETTR